LIPCLTRHCPRHHVAESCAALRLTGASLRMPLACRARVCSTCRRSSLVTQARPPKDDNFRLGFGHRGDEESVQNRNFRIAYLLLGREPLGCASSYSQPRSSGHDLSVFPCDILEANRGAIGMPTVSGRASMILGAFEEAQAELVGKAVALTNGGPGPRWKLAGLNNQVCPED
jgi:hypothetical protein